MPNVNRAYCGALGLPELRTAVASACKVDVDRVCIVPGAQAGLYAALLLFLGMEGGEVVVPTPCYSTYEPTVKLAGGTLLPVPHSAPFELLPHALAAAVTPSTCGVLVTNPNNPTGVALNAETLEQLGAVCTSANLWCISDETYTHLMLDGRQHFSAAHVESLADRTIVIGSFSKVLLRPGWRLGWLIAPKKLMPALETMFEGMHFGLSPFLQRAACEVLQPAALSAITIAETGRYAARRDALFAGIAGCPHLKPLPPDGGMFVMVDVSPTGMTSMAYAKRLMDDHTVACLPGESFGATAEGFLRVALTASETDLREAGQRMAQCAAECVVHLNGGSHASSVAVASHTASSRNKDELAGGVALFVVCLDATNDAWTSCMLEGVRAAAGPSADIRVWTADMPAEQLLGVEAVFCWAPPPGLFKQLLPTLRMVASLGAGVDHCASEYATVASPEVPLVRCVDPLAAQRLAQYVLWATLHLSRRMDDFAEAQAQSRWDSSAVSKDPEQTVVGVMGLGAMGAATADTLLRNGFIVHGWRRGSAGAQPAPAGVARTFVGLAQMEQFLSGLDIVVSVLPLTEATRGILDDTALRMLPPGAAFVNVGRAEVVDESALLSCLDDGHLRRAVLDVAPEEPLPATSPLYKHPRVRLTPHIAGWSSGTAGARAVVDNWRRLRRGEALVNVVAT